MGSLLVYVLSALVVVVVVLAIRAKLSGAPKHTSLPPSPPAEPLIGHARLIPRQGQAEFYHEMRKSYGAFCLSSVRGLFRSNLSIRRCDPLQCPGEVDRRPEQRPSRG